MTDTARTFPPGFLWGAATSAYQIEGAFAEDGKGRSIWDTFSHTPGKVARGETGDVACDHYHRYRDDVALMGDLGLEAYRFSVAWPRVQPDGVAVEPRGLDFYDRLVDALLERNIRPFATLYHWDLPQALQDSGGWGVRDTSERFRDYALVVHERLADRVAAWATLNEPWVIACLGHVSAVHAPGLRDPELGLRVAHHLLYGHGLATQALRAAGPDGSYGIVLNLNQVIGEGASNAEAVRRVDGLHNRLFLDPLLTGAYPPDLLADVAHVSDFGFVRDGDLQVVSQPLDWLGVNYYSPTRVTDAPGEQHRGAYPGLRDVRILDPRPPLTAMGWEQHAPSLTALLLRLGREHPELPLYITENGSAWEDEVLPDGSIGDVERQRYLLDHLAAVLDAIDDGVDVRGYFVWSLMDNFEWAEGYRPRFGIVHVDWDTLRRTVKDSGKLYRRVIGTDAVPSGVVGG